MKKLTSKKIKITKEQRKYEKYLREVAKLSPTGKKWYEIPVIEMKNKAVVLK